MPTCTVARKRSGRARSLRIARAPRRIDPQTGERIDYLSVARLLEIKMGRQLNELATEGYGPDRPIGPNSTVEGRAKNRRIDVVIMQ